MLDTHINSSKYIVFIMADTNRYKIFELTAVNLVTQYNCILYSKNAWQRNALANFPSGAFGE